MIPGTMIHSDTITTHTVGIMDGVWDFHTVIRTGVSAFHTDTRTIILHGILPGTTIHTGEDQGMGITADITGITMAVTIMTGTDHVTGYIMEGVIHFQVPAGQADQYPTQGLQVSQESLATQKQQVRVL